MSHLATVLHVSLSFLREHSRVDKREANTTAHSMIPSGIKPLYILSALPYRLSASLPMAAFLYRKGFPEPPNKTPKAEAETICPNPDLISEARQKSPLPGAIRSTKEVS